MVSYTRLHQRLEVIERKARHDASPLGGLDLRVANQLRLAGICDRAAVEKWLIDLGGSIYGVGKAGMAEIDRWLGVSRLTRP